MLSAVFTIIQHEPDFFPLWYKHYLKHFQPEEIYVLHHVLPVSQDHESSWDSFISKHHAENGYHLIEIHNEKSFDHEWLRQTVINYQKQLLSTYEWVLFAEVDEIIAPKNPYVDLKSYMDCQQKNICVVDGYEIVQKLDEECPIDFSKPILSQRQWWYWSKLYSKPLLSRIPCHWCWGFHACSESPVPYHHRDPELVLVHLHKLDWDICLKRHQSNVKRNWVDGTFGYQNRLVVENRLKQWWMINIDQKTSISELVKIPEEYKHII